MMKRILFAMMFAACSLPGFSQASAGQTEVQFHPHWLLQAQGGVGYTLGELKFDKLLSPSVSLYGGYQFTPVWGVRAGLSGWQSKGGWVSPEQSYKYKYLQVNADVLADLSNWLGGYRADRFFSSYLFGGIAYNYGFDNDEAVALNDAGKTLRYLWRDSRSFVAGRMGIGFNFRLCERVAFNLEGNANVLSDHYNSKKAGNADWHFNAVAGFTFRLGKTRTTRSAAPQEIPAQTPVREMENERNGEMEEPVKPTPKPEVKDKVVTPEAATSRQDIFFELDSDVIRESEAAKITALADFLQSHPAARVVITGYADAQTGNPRYNQSLSQRRAEQVAAVLNKKGIAKDRISVQAKGDTEQPFTVAAQNRVAICVAE